MMDMSLSASQGSRKMCSSCTGGLAMYLCQHQTRVRRVVGESQVLDTHA